MSQNDFGSGSQHKLPKKDPIWNKINDLQQKATMIKCDSNI